MYELAAERMVAEGPLGLLPLTPFMRGADIPTLERAALAAREHTTGADAGDLVSLLAVFTARFHGDAAARELVRRVYMSTELLDESPLYQAWRREAREEGEAKGKAEGLRQAVRVALEGRFGPPDEALLAALGAASAAALLDVLAHVASDSLDQLRARLGGA